MRKSNILKLVLIVTICVAIAITSLSVLTPQVAAASETPITETNETETTTYTFEEEETLALSRAKAVDEAKLEAESIVEEFKVEVEVEQEEEKVSASTQTSAPAVNSAQTQKPATTKPSSSGSLLLQSHLHQAALQITQALVTLMFQEAHRVADTLWISLILILIIRVTQFICQILTVTLLSASLWVKLVQWVTQVWQLLHRAFVMLMLEVDIPTSQA